ATTAPPTTSVTATTAAAAAVALVATTTSEPGHRAEAGQRGQGDPSLQAGPTGRAPEVAFALPTTATAAPAPATAPATTTAPAPAPLAQQLARPLFTLAQAGTGEHVVTVHLVPDSLGPVTVRAAVGAHGMHVELFAASDAGRDAVRQVLPDLRRDAAGSGVTTTLDLSSQNHPDRPAGDSAGRDGRPAAGGTGADDDREARPTTLRTLRPTSTSVRTAGLDVLA
uniref:flagellar hook-length control protein FliK n=2 Tax=unclassified Curtobacterium TaxID=257496 RepID=UPI00226B75B8